MANSTPEGRQIVAAGHWPQLADLVRSVPGWEAMTENELRDVATKDKRFAAFAFMGSVELLSAIATARAAST